MTTPRPKCHYLSLNHKQTRLSATLESSALLCAIFTQCFEIGATRSISRRMNKISPYIAENRGQI